jgi:hypothetical protein
MPYLFGYWNGMEGDPFIAISMSKPSFPASGSSHPSSVVLRFIHTIHTVPGNGVLIFTRKGSRESLAESRWTRMAIDVMAHAVLVAYSFARKDECTMDKVLS